MVTTPDVIIDYMQADLDGVITVDTAGLPDDADQGGHLIVGDHHADPAVARILEIGDDRTTIRILPGSVDDNTDLLTTHTSTPAA